MTSARTAILVAALLGLLVVTGAVAQTPAPSPTTAVAASTASATTAAVDEKLAQVDKALAELESELSELQKLKAELQTKGSAPAAPKEDRWSYKGYLQSEVYWGPSAQATGSDVQYRIRRFYNTIDYKIDDHAKARLLLDTSVARGATTIVQPLDAWIESTTGDIKVRAGQFISPFSLDIGRSSQFRHAHDYARYGIILFPGMYEPGIMVSNNTANTHAGQFSIAAMSGNGTGKQDNNSTKDLVVRYLQPFSNAKGQAYVAYASGKFTTTPAATSTDPAVTTPKSLLGLGVGYASGPWELQGEYVTGRYLGHGVRGAYLEAAYTTGRHTIFGRYDYYDPNTDAGIYTPPVTAAQTSPTVADAWVGPSIGYEYNWSARNRLSFELGLFRDSATTASDVRYQARWQTKW